MKRHCRQLLATETFSMDIENLRVVNNKAKETGIGMASYFYSRNTAFLLRTYLEYVKITTLKADVNSNRRAVVNEYLLCYLGVYVFVI